MSEFESPSRSSSGHKVTIDDVRELVGASTPHFALQIRGRLRRLVAGLSDTDPARQLAEREINRLAEIAVKGERRGPKAPGEKPLRST